MSSHRHSASLLSEKNALTDSDLKTVFRLYEQEYLFFSALQRVYSTMRLIAEAKASSHPVFYNLNTRYTSQDAPCYRHFHSDLKV